MNSENHKINTDRDKKSPVGTHSSEHGSQSNTKESKNMGMPNAKLHGKHSDIKPRAKRRNARERRGVGAIIGGTMLAAVIFSSFFVYFMTMMHSESEKGKADVQSSIAEEERKLELYKVSSLPITGNFLPIIVNNTGPLPLNATHAVLFPEDDPNARTITPLQLLGNATHSPLDQFLNPGESAVYLLDKPSDPAKKYHIDIVSSRGNIMSMQWLPGLGSGGGSGGAIGNVTGAVNIGSGNTTIYVGMNSSNLEFKTIEQGDGIVITSTNDTITISASGDGVGQNNTGINIGSGQASVYAGMNGDQLQFKKITQGSGITLTNSSNSVTISAVGDGVGQNNTGINIGSGGGSVYAGMNGTKLQFKMLVSGSGISITNSSNTLTIRSTVSPGESNDGTYLGCALTSPLPADCQNVYAGKTGVHLQFYSLLAGTGVHLTKSGNDLVISATGEANRGENIGTGESIYKGMNGVNLQFKKISGSGVISVTTNAGNDTITIGANSVGGSGQNNTGQNIGSGQASVYAGMNGDILKFKTLTQGSGIILTNSSNTITLATTAQANDGVPLGCVLISPLPANCQNVYAGMSGVHLQFNSLKAGTGIQITSDGSGNLIITDTTLGTITGAANVGSGTGQVYKNQTSGVLNFRTLKGVNGIVVSTSTDTVDISSSSDNDMIIKPQIQAIFPNPFGVSSGATQPLWGAVVANPSDHPMAIRKLVISANDPTLSSSRILCNNNIVAVTPASTWTCEGQGSTWNVLQWKATGSPVTIAAHDAQLFLAQTGSPVTGANNDRPSVALNYNVYTDFGQFTKVGYDFGVKGSGNHPMVNVFLSSALADKTPSNVVGVVSVQSGQAVSVRASIANYVPSTTVDANAALIIDVPKAFTSVSVTSSTGFNNPCVPASFVDGSSQIKCTLPAGALNTAGVLSSSNVKTIQFTMTAPVVTTTTEYLLYVLGDGTTDGGTFSLGPVSENVIRVTP